MARQDSVIDYNALRKPKREGLKKIKAQRLKPPHVTYEEGDDTPTGYFAVYVSNGREFRDPCTKEVCKKILGPTPQPDSPPPGLNSRTGASFVILKDKTGVVKSLDIVANNNYVRGMIPEALLDKKLVEIEVSPTDGSVEVMLIPAKVKDAIVNDIIAGIDKETVLKPGLKLGGKYLIREVAGNLIKVQPFVDKV